MRERAESVERIFVARVRLRGGEPVGCWAGGVDIRPSGMNGFGYRSVEGGDFRGGGAEEGEF